MNLSMLCTEHHVYCKQDKRYGNGVDAGKEKKREKHKKGKWHFRSDR